MEYDIFLLPSFSIHHTGGTSRNARPCTHENRSFPLQTMYPSTWVDKAWGLKALQVDLLERNSRRVPSRAVYSCRFNAGCTTTWLWLVFSAHLAKTPATRTPRFLMGRVFTGVCTGSLKLNASFGLKDVFFTKLLWVLELSYCHGHIIKKKKKTMWKTKGDKGKLPENIQTVLYLFIYIKYIFHGHECRSPLRRVRAYVHDHLKIKGSVKTFRILLSWLLFTS